MRFLYIRLLILALCWIPFNIYADQNVTTPAPDFSLDRLNAVGKINLSDLKGKVVYLDFWATWCPPCRKSFPWMEDMHTQFKDKGLVIVAVSVDGEREIAEKFVQETGVTFITAIDSGKKTARDYKLRAMPSSYLIDREGKIISTHLGFRTSKAKELENEIRQVLTK